MKRIVLGISILSVLVQNGLAGEKENISLANQYKHQKALYQVLICENEMSYHDKNGDANICIKAAKYINQGEDLGVLSKDKQKYLAESYLNAGLIYDHSGNKLNAYKYYMKSAKTGDLQAQKNLDIMCKKSPWACK